VSAVTPLSRTGPLEQDGARRAGDDIDVRHMPSFAFSHRSLMWWGTLGMVAIEGTVFALLVVTYFYIRIQHSTWPLAGRPPELLWGTANTIVLLLSMLPNHWTKKAAESQDLRKVQIGIGLCLAFAVVFLVLRIFEFRGLHVRWDDNAYGSVVWTLLGAHTIHLLTDTFDTLVLWVLTFTDRFEPRRFTDVSENGMYWYFVVLAWLPIYAVIYLASRG
jgi:cytochrome c oxidase subunit 3